MKEAKRFRLLFLFSVFREDEGILAETRSGVSVEGLHSAALEEVRLEGAVPVEVGKIKLSTELGIKEILNTFTR